MLAAAIDYAPRARALFGALLRSRLGWCIAAAVFLGLRDYLADPEDCEIIDPAGRAPYPN